LHRVWGLYGFYPLTRITLRRLTLRHVRSRQMKTELSTDMADMYPLTPMQQGMLYHGLSTMHVAGTDVEQIFCTLHEEMDAGAFRLAWQRAIDRHAVLRTSFHWLESAGPRQRVHNQVEFEFSEHDWRDVPETERKTLFAGRLEAESRRGFDPANAPLMRLALFRNAENEWQFLWTFHHLLLDGRAVVALLNEVFECYEAFSRGDDLKLPPPRAHRDFIDWLQRRDLARAETFWRQTLKGFEAPTQLGVARGANDNIQGDQIRGEQRIHLSEGTTTALKTVAKENRLTLNILMQGAWALLLSRYSGEEDVVFGAVRACRRSTIEGAETIVGLCINTVPMRIRVPANGQVLPWLTEVRNDWIALRTVEHTPLVEIQGWSEVPGGQSLFESIFNFQDPSWDAALRAQGGKWTKREFGIRSQSNYPLVVDACGGNAVLINILYHRTRFDDASITGLLGHFKTLLEGIASNPEQRLADLPMLTEAERRKLLVEWNDTRAEFPKDKCVHQLFDEQVERTPDALAVADDKRQFTYRELNERSSRLADRLRELGVGPDVCVGVCLERSVGLVVALLAVLKAGGAYVPFDPSYPRDRLAFMLEDARIPVLLSQASLRGKLDIAASNWHLIDVDAFQDRTSDGQDVTNLQPNFQNSKSTDLAYVIYTSGSSGTPKGVEIEHASLINLIAWHQRTYSVMPSDRATQIATPAFDASVWELWPYLTAGASIHFPDEDTRLSPEKLQAWLSARQITLTFIPTPLAEAMLDRPWPGDCRLRALLTGGDKLHRAPNEDFPCTLVNHYGPTENTVVATCASVPPIGGNINPPPIGRPIANTQVYILDGNLQPVPVSVPGQLHIGGAGVARGYHNRPELTNEKFIPDPFNDNPHARLYKTGDLVRWLPDGQIEFLGRRDNQVKLRGQRVEPGEVEAVLARHGGVCNSVVVACADPYGENRLAAYIVPVRESGLNRDILRKFLKQKVPDVMVPSAFVFLDALPLSPNGKVDRKALPAPDFTAGLAMTFVAPHTPTEKALAAIWGDVLGREQVGIHDNFFELGGHSLKATQMIVRAFKIFQVEVPLQDLFDSPTIAELAEKIDAARRPISAAVSVQPQSANDCETPLAFAQERLWFMEQFEPGQPFNNIPFAIRIEGALNLDALERAIVEIVRRHKTLRTAFKSAGGRPHAVVVPQAAVSIPTVDLSALTATEREAKAERMTREEAEQPFDLAQSPLLRAKVIHLAKDDYLLLLTTHHIVCDGWSMDVFYRELTALYQAFSEAKPSPLPPLQLDYADFARSQRERLQGETLKTQLDFWKQQLNGAQTTLDLPTDNPRPPLQTYRGAIQYFALPTKLAVELSRLSRKEDVTLFMLLLAAFQTLLHRYTGQEDMLVGSPVAGRTRLEAENLIGFFLNTLVVRGDLSGDPTFRELLSRIRRVALDAYAHQELPFEKLVEALQPVRDLSRPPLFQAMFVLQNEPLRPLELAGLKLTALLTHSGTAKFDLMLSVEEHAGGLSGILEYNTALFNAETVTRLLGNYQTLLEGVVVNVEQHLSQLPVSSEAERRQILDDWNDTRTEFEMEKCVHQLFEERVERTPAGTALVFGDEQFTYRELNERANRLAHELRALGVGPEVRVGICVKRSLEMMVGLLGILKAGGCYVPLDPNYPKERLAFMLEDAQVPVLLTQDKLRSELKFDLPNLKLLSLDALRSAQRDAFHITAPRTGVKPGNLAYVIYTSGSTGKPKGVMVTHRNVANFFEGMDRALSREPGVWLAVTSISFDISVLELFWTLARGFKVIIHPDDDYGQIPESPGKSTDKTIDSGVPEDSAAAGLPDSNGHNALPNPPAAVKGWRSVPEQILRHGVTHLQCTPSLAKTLVLAPESREAMRRLGKLMLGGEALPVALAKQLREIMSGEIINMYGPTETTVWSSVHRVDEIGHTIPIGRPISNTEIYILDKSLQPAPMGVPGEIFIGGEGVARGYLNRPEFTAEKFILNPFGPEADSRLYRTGDLGRFRADGTIEYLGRIDHQVKIRGHRVELHEIELAFSQHPAVREIVAVAREDTAGDQRLVAYVVAASKTKPTATELRRFALDRLPEAMTPAVFVFLDELPLTPNGKVNRKVLPAPEGQRPELETAYVAPGSRQEKTIAKIWSELLGVEQVGLNDNFFDLGGNSLLVVQVQSRLREALGRDLPIVKLFRYPTIKALAGFLSEREPVSPGKTQDRGQRKRTASSLRHKRKPAVMS
jgi:amino acid adenylation domain-containing protein